MALTVSGGYQSPVSEVNHFSSIMKKIVAAKRQINMHVCSFKNKLSTHRWIVVGV